MGYLVYLRGSGQKRRQSETAKLPGKEAGRRTAANGRQRFLVQPPGIPYIIEYMQVSYRSFAKDCFTWQCHADYDGGSGSMST